MFSGKPILNFIIGIFAVVGLIVILGAVGMTAMHVMHDARITFVQPGDASPAVTPVCELGDTE